MNEHKTLIIGFFIGGNLGDELMLRTFLRNNPQYNVSTTCIYIGSWNVNPDFLNTMDFEFKPKIVNSNDVDPSKFDEYIYVGGALCGHLCAPAIYLAEQMLKCGKVVRFLSVSTTQNIYEYPQTSLKYVVENCQYFSVRDTYSRKFLVDKIGVPETKVKLDCDLYLLDCERRKTIGITPYDWFDYMDRFIHPLIDFASRNKYTINFIPFSNFIDQKNRLLDWISNVDFKDVPHVISPECCFPEVVINIIRGCDIMVNCKYHASVISLSEGVPTLSLIKDNSNDEYLFKMKYINEYFHNESNMLFLSKYSDDEFYSRLDKLKNPVQRPLICTFQ